MTLHEDKNALNSAIQVAADRLQIIPAMIEKDYWISLILRRLSESKYLNEVVFKGGTSLSKGYKLVDRFSEDIDIAIIDRPDATGNRVKNLIRDVEKAISVDLEEIPDSPLTSKGSRFRKSIYGYPATGEFLNRQVISDRLIIEINSFANPYPFESRQISSLIGQALMQNNQLEITEKYGLLPFPVNVLDKRQTMLEKIVSLLRFSFEEGSTKGLSERIRHFYDLYYLFSDKECIAFIKSPEFPIQLQALWNHDQQVFDDPAGWKQYKIMESPLIRDFNAVWNRIKHVYSSSLPVIAYSEIPDEEAIRLVIPNSLGSFKNS